MQSKFGLHARPADTSPSLHVIPPLCIHRRIVPETTRKDASRLLFLPADKKHKAKSCLSQICYLAVFYSYFRDTDTILPLFLLHIPKKQNNFEAAVLFSYFFYLT